MYQKRLGLDLAKGESIAEQRKRELLDWQQEERLKRKELNRVRRETIRQQIAQDKARMPQEDLEFLGRISRNAELQGGGYTTEGTGDSAMEDDYDDDDPITPETEKRVTIMTGLPEDSTATGAQEATSTLEEAQPPKKVGPLPAAALGRQASDYGPRGSSVSRRDIRASTVSVDESPPDNIPSEVRTALAALRHASGNTQSGPELARPFTPSEAPVPWTPLGKRTSVFA